MASSSDHHSWLMRLFQSEHFNSTLAFHYLYKYIKSVGIQYYLCNRLKKLPIADIEFFLPQICHLILTGEHHHTVALEELLLDRCIASSHIAVMTLLYFQSYIQDYENQPNSNQFKTATRFYKKAEVTLRKKAIPRMKKINPHLNPVCVGLGTMLAAIAMPSLATTVGKWSIHQCSTEATEVLVLNTQLLENSTKATSTLKPNSATNTAGTGIMHKRSASNRDFQGDDLRKEDRFRRVSVKSDIIGMIPRASPSLEDLHQGGAFSLNFYIQKTLEKHVSSPDLSRRESKLKNESGCKDEATTITSCNSLTSSMCSEKTVELIHDQINKEELLGYHYYHAEMQFILALIATSERLTNVPKPARQSALQAELSLLNHNLPADVWIPLLTPDRHDVPFPHRVVRISTLDAVCLNSAERVPYLVVVEILENDGTSMDIKSKSIESLEKELDEFVKKKPLKEEEPFHFEVKADIDINDLLDKDITSLTINEAKDISPELKPPQPTHVHTSLHSLTALEDLSMTSPVSNLRNDVILPSLTFTAPSPTFKETVSHIESQNNIIEAKKRGKRPSTVADEFTERMRTAAVMLSQLQMNDQKVKGIPKVGKPTRQIQNDTEAIRERIIREMMILEEKRMTMLKEITTRRMGEEEAGGQGDIIIEGDDKLFKGEDKEDPSAAVFKESWEEKLTRIKSTSPFGSKPNWSLMSAIVKTGADLRQEQFATQLIHLLQKIWIQEKVPIWICYFRVLVVSNTSGLIETIKNTISVHSIKKDGMRRNLTKQGLVFSLFDHFLLTYGQPDTPKYLQAQDCFMRSLVSYSIFSYIFQLKDRHNGNVLLHKEGYLVHIDFGFMLSNTPGSVGFEMAPFKLSQEYLDILGGVNSEKFLEFKRLLNQGFKALRKHAEDVILLVEIMQKDSRMPCFTGTPGATVAALRDRFQLGLTEFQLEDFIEKLVLSSCCNVFTRLYDSFQYYSNGIL